MKLFNLKEKSTYSHSFRVGNEVIYTGNLQGKNNEPCKVTKIYKKSPAIVVVFADGRELSSHYEHLKSLDLRR